MKAGAKAMLSVFLEDRTLGKAESYKEKGVVVKQCTREMSDVQVCLLSQSGLIGEEAWPWS